MLELNIESYKRVSTTIDKIKVVGQNKFKNEDRCAQMRGNVVGEATCRLQLPHRLTCEDGSFAAIFGLWLYAYLLRLMTTSLHPSKLTTHLIISARTIYAEELVFIY